MFELEARAIHACLGAVATEVHHIGSTSVAGIHAKPIIDILVEVRSLTALDDRQRAMVACGYESLGAFGIARRRYFPKDGPDGARAYQVHCFEAGSAGAQRHLAFRDYLRAHPAVAREYSDLKRALALRYPRDIEAYMDGKHEFVRTVEGLSLWWRKSTA